MTAGQRLPKSVLHKKATWWKAGQTFA